MEMLSRDYPFYTFQGEVDLLAGGVKFVIDETQNKYLTEDHSRLSSVIDAIKLYSGCNIQTYGEEDQLIPPLASPKDSLVVVSGGGPAELLSAIQQIALAIFPQAPHSTISALFIHLPNGCITHILSTLPVKPLTKFKIVCKSWYSMINSKLFIEQQLETSTRIGNQMIFVNTDPVRAYNLRIVMDYDIRQLRSLECRRSSVLPHVVNPHEVIEFTMGACSCKGLVCFFGSINSLTQKFMVCNPSTAKYETFNIQYLAQLGKDVSIAHEENCYGFGYNSITEDFNIVTILHHTEGQVRFNIISVSQKNFQSLPVPQAVAHISLHPGGVFSNGYIHWMEKKNTGMTKAKIVSFNLETLQFEDVIVLPDYHPQWWPEHLEILDDKLAFVLKRMGDTNTECVIWMMDKQEGWKQLNLKFTWSYPTRDLYNERPMCLSKTHGILVFESRGSPGGQYKLYDHPSGKVKWTIPVMTPVIYIESLYSPINPTNSVDCTGKEWD